MRIKQILINSIWFGVIPKISTLINVLFLPILTPYLTPYDYGVWGVVMSYCSIIMAIYTLGLQTHLANSFYEYKKNFNIVWGKLLFVLLVSSVLFSVLSITVFLFVLPVTDFKTRVLVAVLAVFPILFNSNSLLANHLFPLRSQPKALVIRNLISSVVGLLVLFVLIYQYKMGYLGFVASAACSALVSFLLFIKPLWIIEKIFPRVEKNIFRLKKNLKQSLPLIPHALGFVLLSSVSRIIMTFYNVPIEEIGLFSNGYIIGDYIAIVSSAVVTSIVPLMQTAYRSGNFIKYRQYFYFSQIIAFITIVLFSIWLPEIYMILIRNPDLQGSMPIAQKISFASAVMPFYYFISMVVFIEKRNIELLWLVFLPGVINIIFCLIFIPLFGIDAAIYSTILSYWSLLLVPFISKFHRIQIGFWFGDRYKIIFIFLGLVVIFFASIFISEFDILFKLLFTMVFLFSLIQVYIIVKRKYDLFIF